MTLYGSLLLWLLGLVGILGLDPNGSPCEVQTATTGTPAEPQTCDASSFCDPDTLTW